MDEKNDTPQNAGGLGGALFQYESVRPSELNLIRKSIRQGWPIKPEVMKKIIDRMELIVENEADDEIAIKAAGIVINADKANIAAEKNQIEEKHNEVIEATQVMRAAIALPASRKALAGLTTSICQPDTKTIADQSGKAPEPIQANALAESNGNGHKNGNGKA